MPSVLLMWMYWRIRKKYYVVNMVFLETIQDLLNADTFPFHWVLFVLVCCFNILICCSNFVCHSLDHPVLQMQNTWPFFFFCFPTLILQLFHGLFLIIWIWIIPILMSHFLFWLFLMGSHPAFPAIFVPILYTLNEKRCVTLLWGLAWYCLSLPPKIPPFTFPKTSSDPINLNVESF